MRQAGRGALLLLIAVGCGDPAPAPEPVAPGGEVSGGGEETTEAPSPAAAPSPELMASLSRDPAALAARLDRTRGLVVVEYFTDASGEDPAADDTGLVHRGERLCGEALDAYVARLSRDLHNRVDNTSFDPLFTCEALTCTFPAEMEYDLSGRLLFRHGEDGGLVLDAVVRIEGGPVTDEFLDAGRRYADERLQALAEGRCE